MGNPQLTIGMATYDDYDGVYFTVQALRLFHPEVTRQTEIASWTDGQSSAHHRDGDLRRL